MISSDRITISVNVHTESVFLALSMQLSHINHGASHVLMALKISIIKDL